MSKTELEKQSFKFAHVVKKSDPIALGYRGPRTTITTESAMWKEFERFLDLVEKGQINLSDEEEGIAIDFSDEAVKQELKDAAERLKKDGYDAEDLKKPVLTFVLRLRKVIKDRQKRSPALRMVRVRIRGEEIGLVVVKSSDPYAPGA
jgi:hypothetical protein